MEKVEEAVIGQIGAMFRCLEARLDPLFAPSEFWKNLCDKHSHLLRRHGFDGFKRNINFEYGQWPVWSLSNQEIKHVLKQLLAGGRFPYVALLSRMENGGKVDWPVKLPTTEFAYRIFVGLVWQLATSRDRLGCLRLCEEPAVGGPIEVRYRGRLISQDLAQSALEINSILGGTLDGAPGKIAELGGGSGRLAYVFARMLPDANYCIFDIPPALAISQEYLAETLGRSRMQFCNTAAPLSRAAVNSDAGKISTYLPYSLQEFPDGYFDLFVNISSLDEMMPEQINRYFDLIDRKCAGFLYLKGYADRDGADPIRPWGLRQFPYRPRWKMVRERQDAIQPSFIERIFDLRHR